MLLNCGVGKDSWESLGLQDPTSPFEMRSVLRVHWKDWCWSWNSNTLATSCKELTHLKRPWCWERLRAGGERDDRGWDGWMASLIQWTWVWVNSRSPWWTGRSRVLWLMGLQRAGHDWVTELNWTNYMSSEEMTERGTMSIIWAEGPCSFLRLFTYFQQKFLLLFFFSPNHFLTVNWRKYSSSKSGKIIFHFLSSDRMTSVIINERNEFMLSWS